LYIEKYRTVNEKKQFFKSTNFEEGTVWYKKQPYYDQQLKYDTYHDELQVELQSLTTGQQATIQLFKIGVDSFDLLEHRFINLRDLPESPIANPGFYESLYLTDGLRLFVKHSKARVERKGDKSLYYEFSDVKDQYILWYKNMFYELNSKKDFLEPFDITKKVFNPIYNRSKRIFKDPNLFMVKLIEQISNMP